MKFISVDPSMSNFGIVWGTIIDGKLGLDGWHTVASERTKNKRMSVGSDTVNRCKAIHEFLQSKIIDVDPKVTFAELPSGSQSSSGAKGNGVSYYAISTINPPPILVTAKQVKKFITGNSGASKEQMMNYAHLKYPDFSWDLYQGKLKKTTMEHVCDAICVAECGVATDQFKQLQSMLR